ncbi:MULTISPECIES: AbgT family transporter [Jonquetella]|uniref:Putative p-aminobenzoyl-glutamate transporter n=1 Tax=Jonquetella anthropi DSM 22815 TaxID=885272 RepID=H0UM60_9BACT|nr:MULTISPECIES: AbgT family transporter [Jonquetella]EHM13636.1 putative p-aminobenzoyl-glutamate transporter [Jonquetella anthropi DSM 22815]ERL24402.1 AbgT transporter family protein [Jonquetella sp. BV3C21]
MAELQKKRSGFERFIHGVEVVGNKLPHPFWLFIYLSIIVLVLSYFLSKAGVSVTYMSAGKAGADAKETTVAVVNLFSYEALRKYFANFVPIYTSFAPLGLIMTMTLGIALLEQSGLISAFMRKAILGAPSWAITATLAVVGINANLASDAGIIFTPAIGGAIFKALGRNPWVGIATGFAAGCGGFTANFFIAGTDALLSGITQSAVSASVFPINAPVHPLMNWYFLMAATVILTLATTFVTEKFTVRVLGDDTTVKDDEYLAQHRVTADENRGLRYALIALVIVVALFLYNILPQGSFFRADNGDIVPKSPFLSGIICELFILFFIVGIAYGYGARTIKKMADVPHMMGKGLANGVSFLVVVLPAAAFIYFFAESHLTTVLAVKGAEMLKAMNLGGIPLLLMFILLSCFVNLFMISGSAKWLILAPIFVPMFSVVGFSPALTQMAYRIGDSSTNIISPLSYYLPVIIGLLEQYRPEGNKQEVGIGTVLSMSMPYSIAYIVCFSVQLVVWYLLKLPMGPGTPPIM